MYIPDRYKGGDQAQAVEFMRKFNFGLVISQAENKPIATHLPFTISQKDDELYISSHFAKANPQWQNLEGQEVMVVFSEPHAYISPAFYNKKQNVPTWNYIAIHAYGQVDLIVDEGEVFKILETLILRMEPTYKEQWDGLPNEYKKGMVQGIVAFQMKVNNLQFKEKLSQNKKKDERHKIINTFAKSGDDNERLIAEYMYKKEKSENDK